MITLQATSNASEVAAAFRDVSSGLEDRLEQLVEAMTGYLEQALQDAAPVGKAGPKRKPGVLKESIHGEASGLTGEFMAVDYAQ
jgi:hypothetical protein